MPIVRVRSLIIRAEPLHQPPIRPLSLATAGANPGSLIRGEFRLPASEPGDAQNQHPHRNARELQA